MSTFANAHTQTGSTEPIVVLVTDANGDELTGKTDIKVKMWRRSDGFFYDWSDETFKAAGHVSLLKTLTEFNFALSPGVYYLNDIPAGHVGGFNTSLVSNPVGDDIYFFNAIQDPKTDASNSPFIGEVKVGGFVDDIVEDRYPVIF
jgi:hypothetical protein